MADFEAIADAIYSAVDTGLAATYPVVRPNEQFDPSSPAGRFLVFAPNSPFILTGMEWEAAERESMGSDGVRNRVGVFVAWCFGDSGVGPGQTLGIADAVAAVLRDARLLSGEVQFAEPLVDDVGEVVREASNFYMSRCVVPFETFSTSP